MGAAAAIGGIVQGIGGAIETNQAKKKAQHSRASNLTAMQRTTCKQLATHP